MYVVCVHTHVFEENQADYSLQREKYVQRPRGGGGREAWLWREVALHGLRTLWGVGWAEESGEIDLEKQAGQLLQSLTWQDKGLGLYLKSSGEPLKALELVSNTIKSADGGDLNDAHNLRHGRADSLLGIHSVYSIRLRRKEGG